MSELVATALTSIMLGIAANIETAWVLVAAG